MVQIKYSHLAFWNTTLRDVCSYIWGDEMERYQNHFQQKKVLETNFLESEYTLRIKRLGELLIKESDKIKCVCFNLNLAGNAR